jgi:hypothetical protein
MIEVALLLLTAADAKHVITAQQQGQAGTAEP